MAKTFFICFNVSPEAGSAIDPRIEGAIAHCWVVESDASSALMKASYKVRQTGWQIDTIDTPPVSVTIENFEGKDWGISCFEDAQKQGMSLFFVGHTSAQDLHSTEPNPMAVPTDIDLHKVLSDHSRIRQQGECLFYESSAECEEIINAHSIQRGQALSCVAVDGYVYSPSLSYGDVKKSRGKIVLRKTHINSMSTFRGLCRTHDNQVFQPIDDAPLMPDCRQVFLYAYRVVLREFFAKKCAVQSLENQLNSYIGSSATKSFLTDALEGSKAGMKNLARLKAYFDNSHRRGRFSDIRYVMFRSTENPTVVFSGGLFPDWGYNGEPIQNLANLDNELSAITFSFAPTGDGWAFLFAWHKSSDEVCRFFISTLQRVIRNHGKIGDLLFQTVAKGCENTAFSPEWIEKLNKTQLADLEDAMTYGSDLLKCPDGGYLKDGMEAPPGWDFDTVSDNLKSPFQRLTAQIRSVISVFRGKGSGGHSE